MSTTFPHHRDRSAVAELLSKSLPWPLSSALRRRLRNLAGPGQLPAKRSSPPSCGLALLGTAALCVVGAGLSRNMDLFVVALLLTTGAAVMGLRNLLWLPLWKVGLKPHLRAVTALSPRAHLYVAVLSSKCATYYVFDILLAGAVAFRDIAEWRALPYMQAHAENAISYLPYEGGHSYTGWLETRYVDDDASGWSGNRRNVSGMGNSGRAETRSDVEGAPLSN